MKKSLNITIGGIAFTIEEDAYEILKKYLDAIEEYFKKSGEGKEILSDIEDSVALKFSDKINTSKKIINTKDVEEIVGIIGTVEEITEADEYYEKTEALEKRPAAAKKRLYRDTDDAIIAGVCSGIAAYFGIDPLAIRLLFLALIFANGFGILAYLIFWIALPKAETNAQKLEMRGKDINLAGIERAVKEKSRAIKEEGKIAIGKLRNDNMLIKILNLPIVFTRIIFEYAAKILRLFWPLICMICGAVLIICSVFSIIGFSVLSSVMIFNINSPYITSDLPLQDLAAMPQYYAAVIAFYIASVLPMIFLSALGIMLIRRKNTFRLVSMSILAGVWMLSVILFIVMTVSLAPMVKTKATGINKADITSKEFNFKEFNKLYVGGELDISVIKGEDYSIKLSGSGTDLDRLDFRLEEGQLQITQKARNGICIFCINRRITGTIKVPRLDSFVGINNSKVKINGFEKDLYISLGESAEADVALAGQSVSGRLSGIDSRLVLTGTAGDITLSMDGSADLDTNELAARHIDLEAGVFSNAKLEGRTESLAIKAEGSSDIDAFGLATDNVMIFATDYANVTVNVQKSLAATSSDDAYISYHGNPASIDKAMSDESMIEPLIKDRVRAYIRTDVRQYNPSMSSIRGIGLVPEFYGYDDEKVFFRFTTDQGYLVEDFDNADYQQSIDLKNADEKLYWTYLLGETLISTTTPIHVRMEVRSKNEDRTITSAQIEFDADDKGMISLKE